MTIPNETRIPGLPVGWLVTSTWVPKFGRNEGFTQFVLRRYSRGRWRPVFKSKNATELVNYAEATERAEAAEREAFYVKAQELKARRIDTGHGDG